MKHILRPSITLLVVAAAITALLSFVNELTAEPIERQRKIVQEKTMGEVFPAADYFIETDAELAGNIIGIFQAISGGQPVGYVIELAAPGYADVIHMMVGVSLSDERLTGMRVLGHRETPGLGSAITNESFYRRFDNRALVPLRVVKGAPGEHEIDSLASATITTAAVTDAVNEAIEWTLGGDILP